jgi:hypothetical protein
MRPLGASLAGWRTRPPKCSSPADAGSRRGRESNFGSVRRSRRVPPRPRVGRGGSVWRTAA